MNRIRKKRYEKLTVLFFGEGGKEKHFFSLLENSTKFKELLPNWAVKNEHASGEGCEVILNKCITYSSSDQSFNMVFCFIDLDKLKHDHGTNYEEQKTRLEQRAMENDIHIIWQDENHEEELERAIGKQVNKSRLRQQLKANELKVVNSQFSKNIINLLTERESELI